ncbi:MAG: NAD(P)/FAD-dependent oxidoreductase [bacterium]|nr:NAD(P)/FAD-dependent oxidoreductase [bacterium]
MKSPLSVAVIGAGPAGSSLALALAEGGVPVTLFHDPAAPPKHCGGGVPARTFDEFPFLAGLSSPRREIRRIALLSPAGVRCDMEISRPVSVFDRARFDAELRERARAAGARIVPERVRSLRREGGRWVLTTDVAGHAARFVAGADGAAGIARRTLAGRFPVSSLSLCAGWYCPPLDEETIVIGLLRRRAAYAWIFPRPDTASAGIGAPLDGCDARTLRSEIMDWLRRFFPGIDARGARPYAALVPTHGGRGGPVCGDGWALVGDAAGVAEPVTREGIHFSLVSARVCAEALLAGRPADYGARLAAVLDSRHRAALIVRNRFFNGRVAELLIRRLARRPSARRRMAAFFSGGLEYAPLLTGTMNQPPRIFTDY